MCITTNTFSKTNTCNVTVTGIAAGITKIYADDNHYMLESIIEISNPIPNQAQLLAVTGSNYNCMLNIANSQIYCWGSNLHGELGNGTISTSITPPTAIYMGGASAIFEGTKLIGVSGGTSDGGGGTTCAISSNNKLYCWGDNHNGTLGIGSNSPINNPYPVAVATGGDSAIPPDAKITYVTANNVTTCALDDKGNAYCWGLNNHGQLGDCKPAAFFHHSYYPKLVLTNTRGTTTSELPDIDQAKLVAISSGGVHTCALDENGNAYCWGRRTALGSDRQSIYPIDEENNTCPTRVITGGQSAIPIGAKITQISVSKDNNEGYALEPGQVEQCSGYGSCGATTCAIANNKGYCWGNNIAGALGLDTPDQLSLYPIAVPTMGKFSEIPDNGNFTSIATSDQHSCAVVDGLGYCWGTNARGQLGNGGLGLNKDYPKEIIGNQSYTDLNHLIYIGTSFDDEVENGMGSCALSNENNFYCFGDNTYGEIGFWVGSNRYVRFPTKVPLESTY